MKKIVCVLLIALSSCTSGISKDDIVGSWTLETDKINSPSASQKNVMHFYPNDTLKIETYSNGELLRSFAGTYQLDQTNKQIITEANNIRTTLKIVSLTSNRLTLKNDEMKLTTQFVRSK